MTDGDHKKIFIMESTRLCVGRLGPNSYDTGCIYCEDCNSRH